MPLSAQEVGDTVELNSSNVSGVPVHPGDGVSSYVRWPNGTVAELIDVGQWFQVRATDGSEGWVTSKYLTVIQLDALEGDPVDEDLAYLVGAWNIEHFHNGSSRGFPENTRGGPNYPQSQRDIGFLARIIRDDLQASILILNEINGRSNQTTSLEMDGLVSALGTDWEYQLSASGGAMRLAILYDTSKARRGNCHEFTIPPRNVQGKDISDRDPFGCLFTLLSPDGEEMNDLVVIGVHLASGQRNNTNHNEGMQELANLFRDAFDGDPFPSGEADIIIAGDFNANRYDSRAENFWTDFGSPNFDIDVLAPDNGEDYRATRLKGVPLIPGSKIDYIMASHDLRNELVLSTAHVHHELLISPFEEFRRLASDHIPLSVRVLLTEDDD